MDHLHTRAKSSQSLTVIIAIIINMLFLLNTASPLLEHCYNEMPTGMRIHTTSNKKINTSEVGDVNR